MSLSATPITGEEDFFGKMQHVRPYNLTFDSSYPAGGYPVTVQTFGFGKTIKKIVPRNTLGVGAPFQLIFDRTAGALAVRLLADSSVPMIKVEEVVTLAGNTTGKLALPPATILGFSSNTGQVLKAIPVGKVPTANQVAVNYKTGAVTALASDAWTSLKVTYIPLGTGPFIEANRVIDEAVVLASGAGVNLANKAAMVEYVYDTTDTTTRPAIVGKSMVPASHTIQINLANSTNTTLVSNAAQNTDAALVTYWKDSVFGAQYGETAQANIATTGGNTLLTLASFAGLAIPCFGNCLVGVVAGPTFIEEVATGPSGTAGTGVALYNPLKGTWTFTGADAAANIELGYIILSAFNSANIPLSSEVATGTNLAAYSMQVDVYGT